MRNLNGVISRLAIVFFVILFAFGCSEDLTGDLEVIETPQNSELAAMNRSTGNLCASTLLPIANSIGGDPIADCDYQWDCCLASNENPLGLGNLIEGFAFKIANPNGELKSGTFFVTENDLGTTAESHGIAIFFENGNIAYLPYWENGQIVSVYWNDVLQGQTTLNMGGWSAMTEVRLYSVNLTQPFGLDMEFCRAATNFGHDEGQADTCMNQLVLNDLGQDEIGIFELETSSGVIGNLGMGLSTPPGEGRLFDRSTDETVLEAVPPGSGTTVVRLQLYDGTTDLKRTVLWTVPLSQVHGPNSIGCPLKLRLVGTEDCDNCEAVTNCPKAGNRVIVDDSPSSPFLAAFDDLMRVNADDRMVVTENGGISVDGTARNMVLRMTDNSVKFGEGIFTLKRNGSLTGNRAFINFDGNISTLRIVFEGGGELVVGEGPHSYTVTTPNGSFIWMLDRDNLSSTGELVLERLEDKVIPITEDGDQIGEIRVPHETLNLIKAQGGNIFVNEENDLDGKVIRVEQINCRYHIVDAVPVDGRQLGVDLTISNIVLFEGDCKIISRVGMPASNVLAANGKHYYVPLNTEQL